MAASLPNPHDAFFKQAFSRREVVVEFLERLLSPDLLNELDLESLHHVNASYVDDDLRQAHSDLVYTVRLRGGNEAVVYMLFEHKSAPDPLAAFQCLKYWVRINDDRRRNGLPIACVIPLLIYHGAKPWPVATNLEERIDVPEAFRRFIPRFSVELFDLTKYSDEELRGKALYQATMLLVKYISSDDLPNKLNDIFGLLAGIIRQPTGLDSVRLVLSYLIQGTDRIDPVALRMAISESFQDSGEDLMPTIAEQWKSEGREEGREEGLETGKLMGQIKAYQELLGITVMTPEEMLAQSTESLRSLVEQLKSRCQP
jgi:predicted transposase/invertase (TIGR01784 family)